MTAGRDRAAEILVVEDDGLLREMAVELLCDEGYSAIGVDGAAEALAFLQASPGTVLMVTDVNMPGMDGLELTRVAHRRFPDLKLMMISGRERIPQPSSPPVEFLQKPFSAQSFLSSVQRLIGR